MLSIASDSPSGPTRQELLNQVFVETEARVRGAGVNDPEAWLQNGVAHLLLAIEEDSAPRLTRAIESLTVASTLDRDRAAIREWLALAHEGVGRLNWGVDMAKAREHYGLQAGALKPLADKEHSGAYRLARVKYADACWHLGQRQEALTIYNETHAWGAALTQPSKDEALAMLAVGAAWQVLAVDATKAGDFRGALGFFDSSIPMMLRGVLCPETSPGILLMGGSAVSLSARWTAILSAALGEPAAAGRACAAMDQWLVRIPSSLPELPQSELAWMGVVRDEVAFLAAIAQPGAKGTAADRDALRRVGLGLFVMDPALLGSLAQAIFSRAMEVHQLLPKDESEGGIRTTARLQAQCAVLDARNGQKDAALDQLRRALALMPVPSGPDVFLADRDLVEKALRMVEMDESSIEKWSKLACDLDGGKEFDLRLPRLDDITPRPVSSRIASRMGEGTPGALRTTTAGSALQWEGYYGVGFGSGGAQQRAGVRAILGNRAFSFGVTRPVEPR